LNASYVIQTIRSAFELGYDSLSVSGGEPLLYPHLQEILTAAKDIGMATSLITNGSFHKSRYEDLKGLVNTIGVSIDGGPALHNAIRQNKNSFSRVNNFLDFAKNIFPSLGISFTLTDESWEQLPTLIEYAETMDVDIFQIYPLEKNGRASFSKYSLSSETMMRAYLISQILGENNTTKIHFNCFSKSNLKKLSDCGLKDTGQEMADIIDLVVLNEHGELLPYTYGLSPVFKIADKHKPLRRDVWLNYKERALELLMNVCNKANQICISETGYFIQYHEILRNISYERYPKY
jgi:MoaA/NifB/PqqE/SkfB family radical SAM enzyme